LDIQHLATTVLAAREQAVLASITLDDVQLHAGDGADGNEINPAWRWGV
jgi:hypothetical protein